MTVIRSDAFGPTYTRLPESAPWDDDETTGPVHTPGDATHKQLVFLLSLSSERGVNLIGIVCEADPMDPSKPLADLEGAYYAKITKRDASAKISAILNGPKPVAKPTSPTAPATPTAPAVEITEGMYKNTSGQIFKVQKAVHGSGHLYAKILETDTDPVTGVTEAWFSYAAGAIRKLRAGWKMTHEQAAEFGSLYGICCCCSKTLTDENSQHNGYGRKCAANNSWPYEIVNRVTRK